MITITDVLKFRESIGDNWKGLLIQANMDFNLIYPVGSIYMSTDSTDPSLLFGGTWEQLENKFLLGAGSTYTAGDSGGSNTHTHTTSNHTLTVNEIPSHTHNIYGGDGDVPDWFGGSGNPYGIKARSGTAYDYLGYTGGGQAHNHGNTGSSSNMPPYLVVYMWKRLTLAPSLPYPTNVITDIGEVETAISIPASGTSVSYNMAGITDEYELIKWNFSSSSENNPPADLTCTIFNGYFTITNNNGTTSETIKPLVMKSKKIAVTAR